MKKLLSILLVLIMIISTAACGSSQKPSDDKPAGDAPSTEKSAKVLEAEQAIAALGEVTIEQLPEVNDVITLCQGLTEDELKQVSNLNDLEKARKTISDILDAFADYKAVVRDEIQMMENSSAALDDIYAEFVIVRKNLIDKKSAPETDAFTKNDKGEFYDNLKDALSAYVGTDDFIQKYGSVSETIKTINENSKVLRYYAQDMVNELGEAAMSGIDSYTLKYYDYVDLMKQNIDGEFEGKVKECRNMLSEAYSALPDVFK